MHVDYRPSPFSCHYKVLPGEWRVYVCVYMYMHTGQQEPPPRPSWLIYCPRNNGILAFCSSTNDRYYNWHYHTQYFARCKQEFHCWFRHLFYLENYLTAPGSFQGLWIIGQMSLDRLPIKFNALVLPAWMKSTRSSILPLNQAHCLVILNFVDFLHFQWHFKILC